MKPKHRMFQRLSGLSLPTGLKLLTGLGLMTGLGALAQPSQGISASLNLKITPGGAIVQGRVTVPREDELTGVWSSLGRARLMRCAPRCQVVSSVPVQGTLMLSGDSGYRVVLGGRVVAGQKISVVLRLRGGLILNVTAPVTR